MALRRRLIEYFNVNRLLKDTNMHICAALLKYGYNNFSVTVLEVCDPENRDNIIAREKHYFEVYDPVYNIVRNPASGQ